MREADATANGRISPALASPAISSGASTANSTVFAISACKLGAPPVKGTCSNSIFAARESKTNTA